MKHCKYYETYSGPKLIKVTVDDIDILSDIITLYGESKNWNETLYTVQDIINIGKKLEAIGDVIYEKSNFIETNNLVLNSDKAKFKLNFEPVWNSEKAILITFEWYKKFYEETSTNKLIESDLKRFLNKKND